MLGKLLTTSWFVAHSALGLISKALVANWVCQQWSQVVSLTEMMALQKSHLLTGLGLHCRLGLHCGLATVAGTNTPVAALRTQSSTGLSHDSKSATGSVAAMLLTKARAAMLLTKARASLQWIPISDTWYLIPGTWWPVFVFSQQPDTWYLIPDTWYLVKGTLLPPNGPMSNITGSHFVYPGSGNCPRLFHFKQSLVYQNRVHIPGLCFLNSGR